MKKLFSSFPRWTRTLVLVLLAIAVAGGGVYGILLLIRGNAAVNVFPLDVVGQYSSAGNAETNGSVTTDRVQSVYISNTQEVTAIHVKEGQKVSVGDELLTFDTTLTDLELERKDIAVRSLELDLTNARIERKNIDTYRIYNPNNQDYTPELEPGNVGQPRKGLGTIDDPLVYLWNESCTLDSATLSTLASNASAQGLDVVYIVFETRQGDSPKGAAISTWEMVLQAGEGGWSFSTIIPSYDDSVDLDEEEAEELRRRQEEASLPSYSWSDIQRMRKEADKKIRDLELQLSMAKVELETVRHELESGVVKSTIDGVVKTVRTVDEVRGQQIPLILVSGGGGYMVTGALSETELDTMHIGDTVSVLSWENYQTYEGTIVSISQFPDTSNRYYHYSEGNRNVSLYPFTVSISEDAMLREGEYVQLSYDPTGEGTGFYLSYPFIRTEKGKSYIWVAGEKGLEKRYVTTGRSLWGSYLQIVEGMEGVEFIAFPYGNLREGQKTAEAGIETLYGY